jgi:hypothetical protein
MNMGELLPIVSGLSLGIFLTRVRPRWHRYTRLLVALLLGFMSSSLNGELRTSWAFLLVDTLLVALAAIAGYVLAQGVRRSRTLG